MILVKTLTMLSPLMDQNQVIDGKINFSWEPSHQSTAKVNNKHTYLVHNANNETKIIDMDETYVIPAWLFEILML